MVDVNAALGHHLFQIAQAEVVGKISANAQQDHGSIKMAAFEHDKLPEKRASIMQQMTFPKSLRQNLPKSTRIVYFLTCALRRFRQRARAAGRV
ncbi:hypothetical protein NKH74_35075, partial [Mesorhizobium sp. M0933]